MAESRFVFDDAGKLVNQGVERLAKNNLNHINDAQGFHSLSNIGQGRAMSLHLYAKPIVKCRVFNTEEKKFEETPLSDYSLKGVRMSVAV
jgi:cysteine dioxygenase